MKREKTVLVRLSNREHEIIKINAENAEMTVSEYIRQSALNSIPERKEKTENED